MRTRCALRSCALPRRTGGLETRWRQMCGTPCGAWTATPRPPAESSCCGLHLAHAWLCSRRRLPPHRRRLPPRRRRPHRAASPMLPTPGAAAGGARASAADSVTACCCMSSLSKPTGTRCQHLSPERTIIEWPPSLHLNDEAPANERLKRARLHCVLPSCFWLLRRKRACVSERVSSWQHAAACSALPVLAGSAEAGLGAAAVLVQKARQPRRASCAAAVRGPAPRESACARFARSRAAGRAGLQQSRRSGRRSYRSATPEQARRHPTTRVTEEPLTPLCERGKSVSSLFNVQTCVAVARFGPLTSRRRGRHRPRSCPRQTGRWSRLRRRRRRRARTRRARDPHAAAPRHW